VRAAAAALGVAAADVVPFSAVEGTGTVALWSRIVALVREDAAPAGAG
jgi:GTP-binding protein